MTKGWLKIEKQWFKIVEVRNVISKESVKWSHTHTILTAYLLDRYKHFQSLGKEFFDNLESIAFETGISLSVVQRRMKDLTKLGALRTTKKKLRGFVASNSYVVLDVFYAPMFQLVLAGGEIVEVEKPVAIPMQNRFVNKVGEKDPEAPF